MTPRPRGSRTFGAPGAAASQTISASNISWKNRTVADKSDAKMWAWSKLTRVGMPGATYDSTPAVSSAGVGPPTPRGGGGGGGRAPPTRGGGWGGGGGPPLRVLEAAAGDEGLLAEAEGLGGDFHELVLADPLERLLEAHEPRRGEADPLVRRGRAHVGELLLLGDVDVEVIVASVLAHNHPFVRLVPGPDEQLAPRLEVVDGVGGGPARPVGHERARPPVRDLALPGLPAVEEAVQEARALGVRQELRAVADQAAGGDPALEADPAGARVHHH